MARFMEYFLLSMAGVYFFLGIFGIYTGIANVLSGGYADNIFLGLIMATGGPLTALSGYFILKDITKRKGK